MAMQETGRSRTLPRYVLAGGVATASHYLLMTVLVEMQRWPAGRAATAGAALGALVAYRLNQRWVFGDRVVPDRRALPRFLAVAGAGAVLNGLLVWLGTALLHLPWLAAQSATTVALVGLAYLANRDWSFARSAPE
jgi:putative flippase GtrA